MKMQEFIDKLIGRLEEEKEKGIYDSDNVINVKDAYSKSISIVNRLAEQHKKTVDDTNYADIELYAFWEKWHDKVENYDWIPVSERLPVITSEPSEFADDVGEPFLITDTVGRVYISTFWKRANEFSDDAIAWMPRPNAYKEGSV